LIKYFDSSVLLSVIFDPGTEKNYIKTARQEFFTSRLSQVEVLRTIMKVDPELVNRAAGVLRKVQFIEITDQIIDDASSYPQEISLKSSDAIHMATAELLLDESDVLITFDKQMALNAERLGIKVLTSF
jgi:predicted nucleic acid-binding protein